MSDNLNRQEYFNMANAGKLKAKVPLSCRKSFSQGVIIPHKMKNCGDCNKDILCDKLVNQKEEFSANFNELKRQPPNELGHMLPEDKTILFSKNNHLFVIQPLHNHNPPPHFKLILFANKIVLMETDKLNVGINEYAKSDAYFNSVVYPYL